MIYMNTYLRSFIRDEGCELWDGREEIKIKMGAVKNSTNLFGTHFSFFSLFGGKN